MDCKAIMKNEKAMDRKKQTTIDDLIYDMACCVDHVRVRAVQVLAHCPEDEDSIKKIYDLMSEAKRPICDLISKYASFDGEEENK